MNQEFEAALLLSREKGVGAAEFKKLIDKYTYPQIAFYHWKTNIKPQKQLIKVSQKKSNTEKKIIYALEQIEQNKIIGLYYGCEEYPEQLLNLTEPPPVLFASSPIKKCKYVAIVGSRTPAPETINIVKQYTKEYVNKGFAIVSGGATGVDGLSHQTAIELGAYTLAVLGCGIDINYPKSNTELLNKIRNNGCIISELMPQTPPAKGFFPTRNRIIAGLADIVIIIQASEKSGSLITANWANKLGKKIIVASPPSIFKKEEWLGSIKLKECQIN